MKPEHFFQNAVLRIDLLSLALSNASMKINGLVYTVNVA